MKGSITDLNLEREAEEIIKDAECPACLRESLKGPCGGVFLELFRCSNKVSEEELEKGACSVPWDAFGECVRSNREYYEEKRRLYEEQEEKEKESSLRADLGDSADNGESVVVDAGDEEIRESAPFP